MLDTKAKFMQSSLSFSSRGSASAADPPPGRRKKEPKIDLKIQARKKYEKVCQKSLNGSQVAPLSLSRRPSGAPRGSPDLKNIQKHIGKHTFSECHKIATLSLLVPLWAPWCLKMEPRSTSWEKKGPQKAPIWSSFSVFFRSFSVLYAR